MSATPLFASSGDLIADRRYQWALAEAARGDLAGAADILVQTVERAPAFASAWFALGTIREALGDRDGAVAAFRRASEADPEDRQGARLHLARLGAAAARPDMTAAYVRHLFDQQAADFDRLLLDCLDYRASALLYRAVEAARRSARRPLAFAAALDLGCGTGLAGAAFRPHVARLVGVDLSPRMIEQARRRGAYDRLDSGDLFAFLAAEAAAGAIYDLVIAADVFVYLPELAPVAAATARVLAVGGLFAFTVETHAGDGARLGETLRYAHGAAHVRAALAAAHLAPLDLTEVSCRREKGVPVPGLVAVAVRAAG